MKKTIALALMALALSAHAADSVYQWGAWDMGTTSTTTAAPAVATVTQSSTTSTSSTSASTTSASTSTSTSVPTAPVTVPNEVIQLVSTGGEPAAIPTIESDLQALKAGNVTATYTGTSSLAQNISMTVNFGQSTWQGVWSPVVAQSGLIAAAQGVISGANISGTVMPSAFSNIASGTISGAFSGAGAAVISGTNDFVLANQSHISGTFSVQK